MKASGETIKELESLLEEYVKEVEDRLEEGFLKKSAADTYTLHAKHFVRWCKGDFEPGGKNKGIL